MASVPEMSASNMLLFNNCNCFANKIRIEMFIKFITLFYFIGLTVIRNERQYLVHFCGASSNSTGLVQKQSGPVRFLCAKFRHCK